MIFFCQQQNKYLGSIDSITGMTKGIKYYSFLEASGYGNSAQTYIRALNEYGVDVSWHPLVWQIDGYKPLPAKHLMVLALATPGIDPELVPLIGKDIEYQSVIIHTVPEYWPTLVEHGKINIGYTAWETDTMPDHWQQLLPFVDKVLVPSVFVQQCFKKTLPNLSVDVVPHVIEKSLAEDQHGCESFMKNWQIDDADFIFYSINSWTTRKNLVLLLHAFLLSFTDQDPVTLLIKTSAMGVAGPTSRNQQPVVPLLNQILSNYDHPAKVVLIDDNLSDAQISMIHQIGDVYVSLTHGEGWGMGAAQAAATGNPVIMTAWGGQLDFLSADSPGLVKFDLVSVQDKMGQRSFQPTQRWARADAQDAMDKLVDAFENFTTHQQHADSNRESLKKFDSVNVARLFAQSIAEINQ